MKILDDYKKIMKEFIGEDGEREKLLKQKIKDKEHPDGVQVGTILKDPDRYDSNLVKKAQSVVDTGGDDASGDDGSSTKLSGPGDFSRDTGREPDSPYDPMNPHKFAADYSDKPKADEPEADEPKDKGGDSDKVTDAGGSKFSQSELENTRIGAGEPNSDEALDMENEMTEELALHYSSNFEDEEMAELVMDESEKLYAQYAEPHKWGISDKDKNLKSYREKLVKRIERKIEREKNPQPDSPYDPMNPHKFAPDYKAARGPKKKRRGGTIGSVGIREPGRAGSGMYDSVQPKKKPFLKEQLERIGGGKY